MSQEPELSRSFAVRRSFRNTVIFYLAFGVFGILGLVLLVRGETIGWILFGFAAAFLTLLLLVNLKPGWAYLIDRSGITIRRPLKPGHIPRKSIAELRVVSDREAVAVVYPDQVEQVRSTRNVDVRSAFRAQRRFRSGEHFGRGPVPAQPAGSEGIPPGV